MSKRKKELDNRRPHRRIIDFEIDLIPNGDLVST